MMIDTTIVMTAVMMTAMTIVATAILNTATTTQPIAMTTAVT